MAKKLIDVQANGFKSYVDATAAEVGAEPALGNPGPGTWFLKTISGVRSWVASIPWAGVDKTGAVATDVGALPEIAVIGSVNFNSINSGLPCSAEISPSSVTNGPPGYAAPTKAHLLQSKGAANYLTQVLTTATAVAFRGMTSPGVWGAWRYVWDDAYLPISSFSQTLLDDANAVAARATLGALASNNPTATGTLTAPDVVVSNRTGTGTRTAAFDSTGKLVVSPGSEEMVLSDFGRIGSGGLWQSAFTDNTSASLRLLANSVTNGTHIRIDQEMEVPFDSGAQYQFALGPYLPPGTGPSVPQYVEAINMADGKYGQGRLEIEVEFIGSGASMVAYVTSTQFRRSGSPFQPITYTGSIPFDATIENWIDIQFNPSSLPGSDYIIRRNRVYRVSP